MKEDDKTILLVTENNDIETKISSLLKKQGYNINIANSKDKNPINKISKPKLILIDKENIGQNIRNNDETKNIPLILISELNKPETNDAKTNYIKYPFKIKDFLKVIYNHIPTNENNIYKDNNEKIALTENPSGIFRIDKKGQFIYVSDKLCSLVKRTKEELVGHYPETWMENNDINKVIDKLNKKQNKDKTYLLETILKHNKKQYTLQITTETDKRNEHIGYIGTITNNKKIENAITALTKSQQKYHSIIASLDEGIIYYTQKNGVEFYNSSARTLFEKDIYKLKEKEIIGTFRKIISENNTTIEENEYPISFTFKKGMPIHNKIIGVIKKNTKHNKTRNVIWLSVNTHPVYENDLTRPSSIVISFRDITKEKEAITEITKSNERLSTLINATPDLISFQDKHKRYITSNNAMLKLFNIKTNSYIGKTNEEIIKEANPKYKKLLEHWDKDTTSKKTTEKSIVLPNGKKKVYDIIKIPVRKNNTHINGSVIFARDITLRKKLQERLERTLRMKGIILENTSSSIAYIKNDKYVWVNNRFTKLTGYKKKEIEHKNTRITYPFSERDYQNFVNSIQNQFKKQDNYSFDFPLVCKDGDVIWARLEGQLVNPENINEGSIWVIENISSQKQEKEILTLHKNQLEKLAQKQAVQINTLEKKLTQETSEHRMSVEILINLKEKYKAVFDNTNNCLITLKAKTNNENTDFIIYEINKKCQINQRLIKEEIEGKNIKELFPENNDLIEKINKVFKNGKSIETQIFNNNRNNNALIYKLNPNEIAIAVERLF